MFNSPRNVEKKQKKKKKKKQCKSVLSNTQANKHPQAT